MSKYGVFSGPYFPTFGLNTESYEVSLCIQFECRKLRARKNSVFGHFSGSEVLCGEHTWRKCILYLLRRGVLLLNIDANTHKCGMNSLKFRGSVLWRNLPAKLKECQSLLEFKVQFLIGFH